MNAPGSAPRPPPPAPPRPRGDRPVPEEACTPLLPLRPLAYIRDAYKVPAEIGARVRFEGKPGRITRDMGCYVGVTLDDDQPDLVRPCHPTWKMEYVQP